MTLTIYHNSRCSKSRQTLALIEAAGHSPEIILYLENPPSAAELRALKTKLGLSSVRDMMRRGEDEYKRLNLKNETDEDKLINAMAAYPRLIERPIVVSGDKAIIGRPPELVKNLLS